MRMLPCNPKESYLQVEIKALLSLLIHSDWMSKYNKAVFISLVCFSCTEYYLG